MSRDRSLLREAAFDYVRTYERWERHQARGQDDLADAEFSHLQDMERGLHVTEVNTAWRSSRTVRS